VKKAEMGGGEEEEKGEEEEEEAAEAAAVFFFAACAFFFFEAFAACALFWEGRGGGRNEGKRERGREGPSKERETGVSSLLSFLRKER
jgi:hypothetical protein